MNEEKCQIPPSCNIILYTYEQYKVEIFCHFKLYHCIHDYLTATKIECHCQCVKTQLPEYEQFLCFFYLIFNFSITVLRYVYPV